MGAPGADEVSRRETLLGGPPRSPHFDRLPRVWRYRAVIALALVVGVIAGGGAVWWWKDRPPSPPEDAHGLRSSPRDAENDVRLVLSGVAPPDRSQPANGALGTRPLRIDGALLHSRGAGTATVTRIYRPGGGLVVRVRALPVTLSVNHSFERVRLRITPGDCTLATEWTPSSQPFMVDWRDDREEVHRQLVGDHDPPMELALTRYLDAACALPQQ